MKEKKYMCNFLHFLPALKLVHVFSILNTLTSVIRELSARIRILVNHSFHDSSVKTNLINAAQSQQGKGETSPV